MTYWITTLGMKHPKLPSKKKKPYKSWTYKAFFWAIQESNL